MSLKSLAERILKDAQERNQKETKDLLVFTETGLKPELDETLWRPVPKAWLENDELRTVGVFESLADEIMKLTTHDIQLQRLLLAEHCQNFPTKQ